MHLDVAHLDLAGGSVHPHCEIGTLGIGSRSNHRLILSRELGGVCSVRLGSQHCRLSGRRGRRPDMRNRLVQTYLKFRGRTWDIGHGI